MATVHVGSVLNFQYCLRSSLPMERMSHNFYPGGLRSGQFRDIPIINLWGKMKMLPVSHKPTENTDHGRSPHLWWSGYNCWLGVTGRSPKVKWGHNPFFANKSRQDGDRDAQMVPNDLARRAASDDVNIDLLGSWSGLDLTFTWPDLRPNFKIDLSRSKSTFSEPTRRG